MFPLEVLVVGVFLFLRALVVLSALPHFPAGHAETLHLARAPRSDSYTCLDPDLRYSGAGITRHCE